MFGQVEPHLFSFGRNPHADQLIAYDKGNHRHDRTPDDGDQNTETLVANLSEHRVMLHATAAERFGREDTGEHRSDHAANTVHTKDVEAIVIAEAMFHSRREIITGQR